ncbi:P-loop containing nucleoside triphosphate hydrolase protein [Tricharina praecox]|uniref:P-loop containing nucleoside triphosphate hydrolase protein n=1 Tax=Tricharina praecox TaxID=43433 RepID=UPI00221FE14C|nr:P-loop containing nucleoside triphosphate hydrolase protein [Tricharina praecox]KAI5850925.1 P-loop containing nucleoside triphosphate hydrolase protein [Tricharina praecox]
MPLRVWLSYMAGGRAFQAQTPDDPVWFLLADAHIGVKTMPRLNTFFSKHFFPEFEAQRPSQVLFLGDTFNIRGATDPAHHRFFTDVLFQITTAKWAPLVHLLVGNHDMKNRFNRQDNSVYPFSLASGKVNVYSETTSNTFDNVKTVFIPYHIDDKTVREYISSTSSSDTVAFYHGPVNGAVMNSHKLCEDAEVSPGHLKKYKHVFLGHFHTHGPVGGEKSRVVYVGSPIQSNMGDAGDTARGFISYRPRANSWVLHRNPHAEYFVKIPWKGLANVDEGQVAGKKVQLSVKDDIPASEIGKARDALYQLGAEMVEVWYKKAPVPKAESQEVLPDDVAINPEAVALTDTVHDLVNSFMDARADAGVEVDEVREAERKAFFLDFIKPYQQHSAHAQEGAKGGVFQGDLESIEMYNFRGLKNTTSFHLDSMPPSEVFLVSGANGSGKSTLIDSIVWCLFGEFVATRIPVEEISYNNASECYVRLRFRNGYTFERSRRGGGKIKKVTFKIFGPDGELQEHGHDATTSTKYLVDNILHMDLSMFKQTVVIGDNAEYFVRAAGDKGRTECLDAMFGLDFLRDIRDELTEMSKELTREVAEAKATSREVSLQLVENQRQWDSRQREMSDEATRAETLEREKTILAVKLEHLRPQRLQLDEVIAQKRALLDVVDSEKHHILAIIEGFSNRNRKYRAAAKEHEQVRKNRDEFLRKQHADERKAQEAARKAQEAEMRDAQRPVRILLSLVKSLWTSLRDMLGLPPAVVEEENLPKTHNQQPSPPFYDQHLHEYINKKIEAVDSITSTHQRHLQQVLSRSTTMTQDLKVPLSRAQQLDQELSSIERRISSSSGQLRLIASQKVGHLRKIAAFSARDIQLQEQLSSSNRGLEVKEHRLDLATFWKTQLADTERSKGGFLTHCRSGYVSHINLLIPSILSRLCSDNEQLLSTEQLLSFVLTADFKLLPSSDALSLARRSRGQLTRTYLALFLAMFVTARARMPFRPNFMFMDEIIDALDEAGMDGLRAWLAEYLRQEGGRAFLLTHREVPGGRSIEVVKEAAGGTVYKLKD